jgi:hypothetical protein
VINNAGVIDALEKSFNFAKEHTIHFGLLILISILIMMIAAIPFAILSFVVQMSSMGGDFYAQGSQVYVPTTADLIVQVIQTFVITGFVTPFILTMFILAYVNATQGKEILEKLG